MPRNLKKNRFIYMTDNAIALSTAAGDIAVATWAVTPPSMAQGCEIVDWGFTPTTAQAGATVMPLDIQKTGGTTSVVNTIDIAATAAGAEVTGTGNGTKINAGDVLQLNLGTLTGTSTTAPIGCLWIGFAL